MAVSVGISLIYFSWSLIILSCAFLFCDKQRFVSGSDKHRCVKYTQLIILAVVRFSFLVVVAFIICYQRHHVDHIDIFVAVVWIPLTVTQLVRMMCICRGNLERSIPAPAPAEKMTSYFLSVIVPYIYFLSLNAALLKLTDFSTTYLLIAAVTLLFLSNLLWLSIHVTEIIRSNVNAALFGGLVLVLMVLCFRHGDIHGKKKIVGFCLSWSTAFIMAFMIGLSRIPVFLKEDETGDGLGSLSNFKNFFDFVTL
ncbi:hypothetical protein ACFE04_030665 [Oxalis oulophora]